MTAGEAIDYNASAGYRLRHAREQLSLSIRDVADAANLLVSHVRAIEANRCDALVQDERFLRRLYDYANLVELDANEVVDSYCAQSAAISEEVQPQPPESKQRDNGVWVSAGVLSFAGVCLAIWLLNQPPPSESSNTATQRNETTEDKQLPSRPLSREDQVALNTSIDNAVASSLPTDAVNAVSVPPAIESREQAFTPDKKDTLLGDNTGARSDQAAGEPKQEQIATAQALTTAVNSTMQTAAPTRLRSTEWFASLAPDRFTLQVLSLTKEISVRAFIQRHHLEDKAAYFAVRKDDETLYGVTYGLYDSYQAAESASKSLPEGIKDLKPWIRNTGRIQQSMLR